MDEIEEAANIIEQGEKTIQFLNAAAGVGICLAVGGTIGYFIAKKQLKAKYEAIIEEERLEMKAYYERHYKTGDFETPASAVEKLGAQAAKRALHDYRHGPGDISREAGDEVVIEDEETKIDVDEPTSRNIFDAAESDAVWDQDQEESKRESNPMDPFVITHDEFNDNEFDYHQHSLTYFAEDDVLLDEEDKPIDQIDQIVGEGNLLRFGHGSQDNRIVYVRNNHLSLDFQIMKKDGSYSKEVLGFQHDDSGSRKTKRFRVGDNE